MATPVPLITGSAADLLASGTSLVSTLGFGVFIMVAFLLGIIGKLVRKGKSAAR